MADGDYERGRDREIAAFAAKLRRYAAERRPQVLVLNGWAASPHAWDLCKFPRAHLISYVEQLDGAPERLLEQSNNPNNSNNRTILVGWSMGGSGALRLACRYPDRIAGLVLLAATPRMMEDKAAGWIGMSPRRLEALKYGLEITHGEGFFGVPADRPNPYCVDCPENLSRGLRYLLETDVRAELERVWRGRPQPPVWIFQSERDGIVRSANAPYLQTIFPQATLRLIPGTEHALPVLIPELIDEAVDTCLRLAAAGQNPA